MKLGGFTVDFWVQNSYYSCEISSPTHDFDNFSFKRSSPLKNLISYDVLITRIYEILEKNFKKISQNLKKLKVYLQLIIYYHLFAHCARFICTGVNPWDIFFMNWQVWHWVCMIQGLLELDVTCIVWIFYQNQKKHKKCLVRISNSNKKILLLKFSLFSGLTRKYLLRGYILGVLTHANAWDQHWGGDETLK